MSDLRKAAQMALEALEYHVEQTRPIHRTSEAIAALRAALAQPEQEPVAWMQESTECIRSDWSFDRTGYVLLYTHPTQRKPLTDDQIAEICMDCSLVTPSDIYFARAIERAHGIE